MAQHIRIYGDASSQLDSNIIQDAGFCYGYGAFETCQIINKHPILIEAHLDRLIKTLEWLSIPLNISKRELKTYCINHINETNIPTASFNLYVTAGQKSNTILPFQNPKIISVIKTVDSIQTTTHKAYLQEEHTPRKTNGRHTKHWPMHPIYMSFCIKIKKAYHSYIAKMGRSMNHQPLVSDFLMVTHSHYVRVP